MTDHTGPTLDDVHARLLDIEANTERIERHLARLVEIAEAAYITEEDSDQ